MRKTRLEEPAAGPGGGGSNHDSLGDYYVRTFEREVSPKTRTCPQIIPGPRAHVRPMGSSNFA